MDELIGKPKVQQWEYKIEMQDFIYMPDKLNAFGEEGWELISACKMKGLKVYYFKRPLP